MEGTTSKSESMRKKSLEARKLFNLPETESVIQGILSYTTVSNYNTHYIRL